jgi:hypothetical protein
MVGTYLNSVVIVLFPQIVGELFELDGALLEQLSNFCVTLRTMYRGLAFVIRRTPRKVVRIVVHDARGQFRRMKW